MTQPDAGGAAFNPVVRTEDNAPAWLNEDDFRAHLVQLRQGIPADVLAAMREAHDLLAGCNAHSEGQDCCVDWLVGDDDNGKDVA